MKLNGSPRNSELTCLLCSEPVLATYLCRKHYHQKYRADRERVNAVKKEADQRAREKALRKALRESGVPCNVPHCGERVFADPGVCKPHHVRARAWGLDPQELVRLYGHGGCEICGATGKMVLDHEHGLSCEVNHKSRDAGCRECFRGILCNGCNGGIGFLQDDPAVVSRAAAYLRARNSN